MNLSRVPPGVTQHDSRPGLTDTPIICGVETGQISVSGGSEPDSIKGVCKNE